jgi:hypothetical protein
MLRSKDLNLNSTYESLSGLEISNGKMFTHVVRGYATALA